MQAAPPTRRKGRTQHHPQEGEQGFTTKREEATSPGQGPKKAKITTKEAQIDPVPERASKEATNRDER